MIATAPKALPTAMVRVLALDNAAIGVAVTVEVAVAVDVGTVSQPWGIAVVRHKPESLSYVSTPVVCETTRSEDD